jgi:hypothetical protein
MISHWSLFSPMQYSCHNLTDIQSLRAVRHGKKRGFNHDSTKYSIKIYFASGQTIRILTTKDTLRVKKLLLCMRRFLQIELTNPISIHDEAAVEGEIKTLKQRIL